MSAAAVLRPSVEPTVPYRVLALGGSAGAIQPLQTVLSRLPADFPIPIVVVQHLPASLESRLPTVLGFRTRLRCRWSEDGELPRAGTVHVARPGMNLVLGRDERLRHIDGAKPRLG